MPIMISPHTTNKTVFKSFNSLSCWLSLWVIVMWFSFCLLSIYCFASLILSCGLNLRKYYIIFREGFKKIHSLPSLCAVLAAATWWQCMELIGIGFMNYRMSIISTSTSLSPTFTLSPIVFPFIDAPNGFKIFTICTPSINSPPLVS